MQNRKTIIISALSAFSFLIISTSANALTTRPIEQLIAEDCAANNGTSFIIDISFNQFYADKYFNDKINATITKASAQTTNIIPKSEFNGLPFTMANNSYWVLRSTQYDKKPEWLSVKINQKPDNSIEVSWQRAIFENDNPPNNDYGATQPIGNFGELHKLYFTPNKENKCWSLHSVETIYD